MAEMTVRNFVIDSLHKFFVKIMQNINDASPWKSGTGSSSAHLDGSLASGNYSVAEGNATSATTQYAHAEGNVTLARGEASHAEGGGTEASGTNSHAEGSSTIASGEISHAEGDGTQAIGTDSHAEGAGTEAYGNCSHAEGSGTITSGFSSHAEGNATSALTSYSHAEGSNTIASGVASHAEGYITSALTAYTHCEGYGTIATNQNEHAQGKYNLSHSGSTTSMKTIHSVGYGTAANARKNLVEVMQNGDVYIQGIGGFTGANTGSTRTLQYAVNNKAGVYAVDTWQDGLTDSLSSIYSKAQDGRYIYLVDSESEPSAMPLSYINVNMDGDGTAAFGGYDPSLGILKGYYITQYYDDNDNTLNADEYYTAHVFLKIMNYSNNQEVHDEEQIYALPGYYYFLGTGSTHAITTFSITIETGNEIMQSKPHTMLMDDMFMIRFTTGTSPNITISSGGNDSIKYYDGAGSFQANTDYELCGVWNGFEWIISQAVLS